ncbi:ABC transporter substrate-binding protein [uncultured Nocardioides sp.]|uniref:ABC transporter substrate-binding protein n=1 Tax=uncultured Nocardioides sp. TaxID=198441 RepID=UPI002611ECAF|nr:ABC transporter substrate-binding protein [uncultured Nocardioides sp.]
MDLRNRRARGPAPSLLAAALAATLLVAGCSPVQPRQAVEDRPDVTDVLADGAELQQGGELAMGLSAEPDVLDPTTSSSLYTRYVMNTICEKLYDIDADNEIVPQLAADLPTVRRGGREVEIPLRDGIRFADGEDFDAAAVQQTLERHLTKDDSARSGEMGPVTDISTPDDRTVVLSYDEPFAPITASLADRAGMIMSPAALDELGDDFGQSPVCVGPFTFVERVPQTSITVEKDPLYYDADEVMLDEITYRIITDANIRAANLRAGEVQVIDTVSPQDISYLRRDDSLGTLQVGSLGYQGVTFNLGNTDGVGQPPGEIDTPLAQDPRLRQAFELSIDREALVNSVFNNEATPACSAISPDTPYATDASNACPEHDPEESLRLLEEAGVETPVEIEMTVSNTPDTLRLAQALQAMVREGGFDIEIAPVEYSTLLDQQDRGDFEALQLGWSGRIDPHGNLFGFVVSEQPDNVAGYSDPQVDELMTRAAQEEGTARRARTYGEAIDVLREDLPIVYLYRVTSLTAYSREVTNISTYADGVVRLGRAAYLADPDDVADAAGEGE